MSDCQIPPLGWYCTRPAPHDGPCVAIPGTRRPTEFERAQLSTGLSEEQKESAVLLSEECAESVQRLTKILRFGLRRNPYNGEVNGDKLALELGDILANIQIAVKYGLTTHEKIEAARAAKIADYHIDPTRPPEKRRLRFVNSQGLK